jgi:hypothetical protein
VSSLLPTSAPKPVSQVPRLHFTKSLYSQHHFSQPHTFSTRFSAPIRPNNTLPAFFSSSSDPHRVRLILHRLCQHSTTRILTAKQPPVNAPDLLQSSTFCKYPHLLLSQNRASSRRVVVFCDRVTSRAYQPCSTITHSPTSNVVCRTSASASMDFICVSTLLKILRASLLHLLSPTSCAPLTRPAANNQQQKVIYLSNTKHHAQGEDHPQGCAQVQDGRRQEEEGYVPHV